MRHFFRQRRKKCPPKPLGEGGQPTLKTPYAKIRNQTLDAITWPAFARLVEASNGVWGGCWCMWYHAKDKGADGTPALRRKAKECLVRKGRAHSSLVFDAKDCVGWRQFGSPEELPRIHNQRAYLNRL